MTEMPKDDDHEMLMDHMALEAMHAVDSKDKESFRGAFHGLVSGVLDKMRMDMDSDESGGESE